MILNAVFRWSDTHILFKDITEIVRVVISGLSCYLRTFDTCGAQHFLGFIQSEIYQILGKGLSRLL